MSDAERFFYPPGGAALRGLERLKAQHLAYKVGMVSEPVSVAEVRNSINYYKRGVEFHKGIGARVSVEYYRSEYYRSQVEDYTKVVEGLQLLLDELTL